MVAAHPLSEHLWFSRDSQKQDGAVVKRYFAVSISKRDDAVALIGSNQHLYEIIPDDCPIKPYFDCEMENVEDFDDDADHFNKRAKLILFLQVVKSFIKKNVGVELTDEDFIIIDSCRENKLSYHVIINNKVFFASRADHKVFIQALHDFCQRSVSKKISQLIWTFKSESTEAQRFIFDTAPYGHHNNFRLPNQSKLGKPYILKTDAPLQDCFIRIINGEEQGKVIINVDKWMTGKSVSSKKSKGSKTTPKAEAKPKKTKKTVSNEVSTNDDADSVISEVTCSEMTSDETLTQTEEMVTVSSAQTSTDKYEQVQKIYQCLGMRFFEKSSHKLHCNLCFATANVLGELGREIFCKKTKAVGTKDKARDCDYQFTKCLEKVESDPDRLQFGLSQLKRWAFEDNEELFKMLFPNEPSPEEPKKDYVLVENDNEAVDHFYDQTKDTLISCDQQLFCKDGNVWVNDAKKIENFLLSSIMQSNVKRGVQNPKGELVIVPYAQNTTKAINIRTGLLARISAQRDTPDIYRKFHDTTRGRLCFQDGVLDMKEQKFTLWEDVDFDYYSCVQIKRDYADYFDKPDMQTVEEIKAKIFQPLFGDQTETALHFLSRAIAGHHEDKKWATYLGNRDCGKGVLYEGLSHAFGNYVKSFELGNILYQRNTNKPLRAVDLYWLLDMQFVRLGVSQEIPPPSEGKKASGAFIKKMASGGDTIVARRNFDRYDTHFNLDTTWLIMGNDVLDVEPKDTLEHCIEFSSICQFKSQEEIDAMRLAGEPEEVLKIYNIRDDTIKAKLRTEKYMNAFVYLLYNSYKPFAITKKIVNEEEHNSSIRSRLFQHYEFTGKRTDSILCQEIYENPVFKDECKSKIRNEMKSIAGVDKEKSNKLETRNKWCYVGVKPKIQTPDNQTNTAVVES